MLLQHLENKNRQEIDKEIEAIAEKLLQEVLISKEGYYWTTKVIRGNSVFNIVNETIYNGVAGVTLFFIELYRVKKNNRYYECILQSSKWMIWYCTNNKAKSYAFYTGRLGTAYVLSLVYAMFPNKELDIAICQIIDELEQLPDDQLVINDLINGNAGIILGLMLIHEIRGGGKIIKNVERLCKLIISNSNVADRGYFWDSNSQYMYGLCGFSHGVSGISFALAEAGYYFNNNDLIKFAEESLRYEQWQYSKNSNDWPDLRVSASENESDYIEELRKLWQNGNHNKLRTPSFMKAWCHGAPGIGLSRIRMANITKSRKYILQLYEAVQLTRKSLEIGQKSFTLCHGNLGNAFLLMHAYYSGKKRTADYEMLLKYALQAIEHAQRNGFYSAGFNYTTLIDDNSLFNGTSGIGYFFLKLLYYPINNSSILFPVLSVKSNNYLNINSEMINQILLRKNFKMSSGYLSKYTNLVFKNYKFKSRIVSKELKTLLSKAEYEDFRNDYKLFSHSKATISFAYEYFKLITGEFEYNKVMNDPTQINFRQYKLSSQCILYRNSVTGKKYIGKRMLSEIFVFEVSHNLFSLLKTVEKKFKPISSIEKILNPKMDIHIKNYLFSQIAECIRNGIIEPESEVERLNSPVK